MNNLPFDHSFALDPGVINNLEDHSGVYFLLDDQKQVIYIGQTNHFKTRLYAHYCDKRNNVFHNPILVKTMIIEDQLERIRVEKDLILKYKPPLNKQYLIQRPVSTKKKVSISVVIDRSLYEKVKVLAAADFRSFNNLVVKLMQDHVDSQGSK